MAAAAPRRSSIWSAISWSRTGRWSPSTWARARSTGCRRWPTLPAGPDGRQAALRADQRPHAPAPPRNSPAMSPAIRLGELIGETTAGAGFRNDLLPAARRLCDQRLGRPRRARLDRQGLGRRSGIAPTMPIAVDKALDARPGPCAAPARRRRAPPQDKARATRRRPPCSPRRSSRCATALPLAAYAGTFGERKVWVEDGRLAFQREGGPKFRLVPIGPERLRLRGGCAGAGRSIRWPATSATGFELVRGDGSRVAAERTNCLSVMRVGPSEGWDPRECMTGASHTAWAPAFAGATVSLRPGLREAAPGLVVIRLQRAALQREAGRAEGPAAFDHEGQRVRRSCAASARPRSRAFQLATSGPWPAIRLCRLHAARREAFGLGVVGAVDQAHALAHHVAVEPGRAERVLGDHPARREDDEIGIGAARHVADGRGEDGEDRRIGMVEADRADRVEAARGRISRARDCRARRRRRAGCGRASSSTASRDISGPARRRRRRPHRPRPGVRKSRGLARPLEPIGPSSGRRNRAP